MRPYLSELFCTEVFKEFLSFRMVCIEQMSHVGGLFVRENGLKELKKMRKLIMGKKLPN